MAFSGAVYKSWQVSFKMARFHCVNKRLLKQYLIVLARSLDTIIIYKSIKNMKRTL